MTLHGICKRDTWAYTEKSSTGHRLSSSMAMPLFRKTLTVKDTVYGQFSFRKYCQDIVRILTVLFWTLYPLSLFSCFGKLKVRNVFALSFVSLVRIKLSNQNIFSLDFRQYSSTVMVAQKFKANQIQKLR
jgi:hypothetical protein